MPFVSHLPRIRVGGSDLGASILDSRLVTAKFGVFAIDHPEVGIALAVAIAARLLP